MQHVQLGLIGDKIQASRSPDLHRLAGRLCGLDVSYDLLIPPARGETFDAVFDHGRTGGYRGINVTYPYKERVLSRLASPAPGLTALGACNTVVFDEGGPRGANTDCTGFASAFRHRFGEASPGVVAMAGAGGVGKAIAFALVSLGAREIRLCDADRPKAEALAAALAPVAEGTRIVICDSVVEAGERVDGIVNATPLGMAGVGGNAIPDVALDGAGWAFDAVYTPEWTEFLTRAREGCLDILSGYELFLFQGIDAFRIFTGHDVDAEALRRELAGDALREAS
ncbi:MAG: shikimate dehydrogenase family protein [Phreatobacter sp.]|uniref:shikimate dehydrogenase family protein n=1 Tax=Phreatobacter sp. TaxID=1966341 RepID=UPI0040367A02